MERFEKQMLGSIAALLAVTILTGCADPTKDLQDPLAGVAKKIDEIKPVAQAGVDKVVSKSMAPDRLNGLIASTAKYGFRSNPFALSADEIKFDESQASERFLAEQGHFANSFELPEDKDDIVAQEEAQPYRRISGIVIGDAVYAILEENGQSRIIRPGMQIPDSNWTVVSINRDEVKLRRPGNVQPNEVIVRLEVAPPGIGGAGAQGGPAGGPGRGPGNGGGAPSGQFSPSGSKDDF